ncbi:hypothetical protein [Catenulispora rubra]|nr:hypothetical protein [Catenulispora rubra]
MKLADVAQLQEATTAYAKQFNDRSVAVRTSSLGRRAIEHSNF